MKLLNNGLCTAMLACGVAMTPHASAATIDKRIYLDPAMSCQLSLPTIDTAVRPRATGYRNEGDTSTYVICGLPYYYSGAIPSSFAITLSSFDGKAHDVGCTGVTRYSNGLSPAFSTKTISIPANSYGSITWTGADLTLGNFDASVTCTLPKGIAIVSALISINDEIGN